MWKLKNSEGREQLCHTLDEVVAIVLSAPALLEYVLKFIPIYEKPKQKSLKEQQDEQATGLREPNAHYPIPLSNQD